MNVYKKYLVIFGGAGPYNEGLRVCYKFLHFFDTVKEKWVTMEDNTPPKHEKPEQRMHHASAIFGNILMIHGGFNSEDKHIYDDTFLYDLELHQWITLKKSKHITEALGKRQMHTMTTILNSD